LAVSKKVDVSIAVQRVPLSDVGIDVKIWMDVRN